MTETKYSGDAKELGCGEKCMIAIRTDKSLSFVCFSWLTIKKYRLIKAYYLYQPSTLHINVVNFIWPTVYPHLHRQIEKERHGVAVSVPSCSICF
jgi:hypothetical protein